MQNEPQDSTPEQTNLPVQESQKEQPSIGSEHIKRGKEYGLTPQQSEELSLYL